MPKPGKRGPSKREVLPQAPAIYNERVELLKKIQELVNFLLRYVVAGGSAVLVFGLTQHDPFSFLRVGVELSPVLVLLFVSVIGPAIYSTHRAALHPVILIPIFIILSRGKQLKIGVTAIGLKWWKLDRKLAESKEKWRTDNAQSGLLATYDGPRKFTIFIAPLSGLVSRYPLHTSSILVQIISSRFSLSR